MKTILIVDDDHTVTKGLLDHVPWSKLNIEVQDTANDGTEALEKVRKIQPDIVITDIYMPNMNGLELIKKLHDEFPTITIIIHSGYDDFDNAREAMKYGVKHFLLKPAVVSEIQSVLNEVVKELVVKEKQKDLIHQYNIQMNEYIPHLRESFFREILSTNDKEVDIPAEKLKLLNLEQCSNLVVISLDLIRSPYLTKSKEEEWQLNKFAAGNIIRETIKEQSLIDEVEIYVVDYSDSMFLLICIEKQGYGDLNSISRSISQKLVEHILLYLEISLVVGIGNVKQRIDELSESYIESQKALEAAEYEAINQVYTYSQVHKEEKAPDFQYPLDILKEINDAVTFKDYDQMKESWLKIEKYIKEDKKIVSFMVQNICISIVSTIMMHDHSDNSDSEEKKGISDYISEIYEKYSSKELMVWMNEFLKGWIEKKTEEVNGKKSNRLINEVKKHVHNYYDQEISLGEIAENLFVNRNYLSQLFKKVTGESFVTYLNKYRIEKAKEKLREKNYLVYEISEMVGYQNPTYFSQVFKSITGYSPSDYYK
ncbi:YesN/AraC family two-component response regulator [Evansella vedderi]|uniref:YesN/AraC family two-component response regulator n=1 Tax=Evansella vedderi TaxID=38282 RepID=A0ABT9ZR22_9BACI|nr:response regulator [Evansella vedderi]MDQ0253182.1 YesN/AraC family two-component response regulator [Evansella vedderi]